MVKHFARLGGRFSFPYVLSVHKTFMRRAAQSSHDMHVPMMLYNHSKGNQVLSPLSLHKEVEQELNHFVSG